MMNLTPVKIINLLLFFLLTLHVDAQTIKVFVMAGQSNMQGQGDITPDVNLDGIVQVTDYDLWFQNKAKVGPSELAY